MLEKKKNNNNCAWHLTCVADRLSPFYKRIETHEGCKSGQSHSAFIKKVEKLFQNAISSFLQLKTQS